MPERNEQIRGNSGGNPKDYQDMAKDLFNRKAQQGSGKQVNERASFGNSGNPKGFLEMAKELRRDANSAT
ncbi:MAG: hypothetical protein HC924_06585 [Synechococcaceae cyanobacterium SM2_3_2]|nr:hypothetical protein [Synechococcaceae cyanobacterium SM2_3_2]